MKPYVDGYLLSIPKKNVAAYQKMAEKASKIWMRHGALSYFECVGEDLKPNMGGMKLPTFPQVMENKPSETNIFAFIVYKSRAHRDKVNKKVMMDPEMTPENFNEKDMPFDTKRMAYGGFQAIVSHQAK